MDKNNIYYKMLAEDQIVRESVVLVCGISCRGYLYMVGAECADGRYLCVLVVVRL